MIRVLPRLFAALLVLVATHALAADPALLYETHTLHDPDGIGKFYMGREIADVMGPGGISWLERPERDAEEQTQKVIEALKIKPGDTVADLGAGSGYFSFRMAKTVGDRGKVYAVDIQPEMLTAIRSRATREHVTNVEAVASTETDPKLPPNSVDLVLLVDVYHELAFPYEVMAKVRDALKPGGRIALVEYRKEDPAVAIKEVHKMSEAQVVRELTAAGFTFVETVRTLPQQHLVILRK